MPTPARRAISSTGTSSPCSANASAAAAEDAAAVGLGVATQGTGGRVWRESRSGGHAPLMVESPAGMGQAEVIDRPAARHGLDTRRSGAGRRRVRAAPVARRPRAHRPAGGPERLGVGRRVDLHRVPARGLGGDADRRPPRRHLRQEARARDRARGPRGRLAHGGPRQHARADDRRPRDPGPRRRDLPARLRDHPRRVPAPAHRRLDRPDVRPARHRRRARDRALRRDPRQPLVPLALLDPARS